MFAEHDLVALTVDAMEGKLIAGDVGVVVAVHGETKAYTVEFMTIGGNTIALLTLSPEQLRLVSPDEMTQARPVRSAA